VGTRGVASGDVTVAVTEANLVMLLMTRVGSTEALKRPVGLPLNDTGPSFEEDGDNGCGLIATAETSKQSMKSP